MYISISDLLHVCVLLFVVGVSKQETATREDLTEIAQLAIYVERYSDAKDYMSQALKSGGPATESDLKKISASLNGLMNDRLEVWETLISLGKDETSKEIVKHYKSQEEILINDITRENLAMLDELKKAMKDKTNVIILLTMKVDIYRNQMREKIKNQKDLDGLKQDIGVVSSEALQLSEEIIHDLNNNRPDIIEKLTTMYCDVYQYDTAVELLKAALEDLQKEPESKQQQIASLQKSLEDVKKKPTKNELIELAIMAFDALRYSETRVYMSLAAEHLEVLNNLELHLHVWPYQVPFLATLRSWKALAKMEQENLSDDKKRLVAVYKSSLVTEMDNIYFKVMKATFRAVSGQASVLLLTGSRSYACLLTALKMDIWNEAKKTAIHSLAVMTRSNPEYQDCSAMMRRITRRVADIHTAININLLYGTLFRYEMEYETGETRNQFMEVSKKRLESASEACKENAYVGIDYTVLSIAEELYLLYLDDQKIDLAIHTLEKAIKEANDCIAIPACVAKIKSTNGGRLLEVLTKNLDSLKKEKAEGKSTPSGKK